MGPATASRANRDLAPGLEEIISKALDKDRAMRCQSAAELRADLMRLRRDSESGARPPAKRAEPPARDRRRTGGGIRAQAVLPLANLVRDPEQYQGALEMDPTAKLIFYWLWLAYEQHGDFGQALAELRRLTNPAAEPETQATREPILTRESYMAGLRDILPQLQVLRDRRILSTIDVAAIHTWLGETDQAFECLDRAYRDRDRRLPFVKLDPRFDSLQADARFDDLLRRMNLKP